MPLTLPNLLEPVSLNFYFNQFLPKTVNANMNVTVVSVLNSTLNKAKYREKPSLARSVYFLSFTR